MNTPAKIVIALLLTGFLFTMAVLAYEELLGDYDLTPPELNSTGLNQIRARNVQLMNNITAEKDQTSPIAGLDTLTMGWGAVTAVFTAMTDAELYVSYIRQQTGLKILPEMFWGTIIAIIFVLIMFAIIGAVWRYNMVNGK